MKTTFFSLQGRHIFIAPDRHTFLFDYETNAEPIKFQILQSFRRFRNETLADRYLIEEKTGRFISDVILNVPKGIR